MSIFWCILHDGRHNSVTADNTFEAQRRARALNAKSLHYKNMVTKQVAELAF